MPERRVPKPLQRKEVRIRAEGNAVDGEAELLAHVRAQVLKPRRIRAEVLRGVDGPESDLVELGAHLLATSRLGKSADAVFGCIAADVHN